MVASLLAGSAFLDGCITDLWTHCQARTEKEASLFPPVFGFRRDLCAEITTFLPVGRSALSSRNMLMKEYRICMPLTVEEVRSALVPERLFFIEPFLLQGELRLYLFC